MLLGKLWTRMSLKKNKRQKVNSESLGGLFFYFSISSLCIVNLVHICSLFSVFSVGGLRFLGIFLTAIFFGKYIANVFLTGYISVFLHEFKHSLFSGFVGNRPKKLKIGKNTGAFTYEYTRETAKYNAIIALAPYWTPLFTVPMLTMPYMLQIAPLHSVHTFLVGLAYGADLTMSIRDIGPHQTDFSRLTGGYFSGIIYVFLINSGTFFTLVAWIIADTKGLAGLAKTWWIIINFLVGQELVTESSYLSLALRQSLKIHLIN